MEITMEGPEETFTKDIQQAQESGMLDLSCKNIGDEDVKVIVETLKRDNSIYAIDFSMNNIGPKGAKVIAEMLKRNNSICTIHLHRNKTDDEFVKVIAEALENNVTICTLTINTENAKLMDRIGVALRRNVNFRDKYSPLMNFVEGHKVDYELDKTELQKILDEVISLINGGYHPAIYLFARLYYMTGLNNSIFHKSLVLNISEGRYKGGNYLYIAMLTLKTHLDKILFGGGKSLGECFKQQQETVLIFYPLTQFLLCTFTENKNFKDPVTNKTVYTLETEMFGRKKLNFVAEGDSFLLTP